MASSILKIEPFFLVGIQRRKPTAYRLRTLKEFGFGHAIRLRDGHTVRVAESPVETFFGAKAFGDREHESSRPGNQRREQGVKISTGLFDLFGCDGKTFATRAIASQVLRVIEIGDIDFNEDPIAGGVRQNFEGLLLAVERVSVQSRRVLQSSLDGCPQVNQPLEKVIVGRVDLIVGVAGNR